LATASLEGKLALSFPAVDGAGGSDVEADLEKIRGVLRVVQDHGGGVGDCPIHGIARVGPKSAGANENIRARVIEGVLHREVQKHGQLAAPETVGGEVRNPSMYVCVVDLAGQRAVMLIGDVGEGVGDG
jgi:hypothetical protein